jgi:hypothetical protein
MIRTRFILPAALLGFLACLPAAVAQQPAEAPATDAAQSPQEVTERPDAWWRPTEVEFFVFIVDIDKIDGASQNFAANVFVRLRWKDKRLADTTTSSLRRIPLHTIWNPNVLIANQTGVVWKSLAEVALVEPDGTVTYSQRYVGTLSQPLLLTEFPLDSHRFTIQFIPIGYTEKELRFVPGRREAAEDGAVGGGIAEELSLPDWVITETNASTESYQPIKGVNVPGFRFEFVAKRKFDYYLWQLIIPLAAIVIMSWAALWIPPGEVGVRVGIATSAMLSIIAYRFILANLLPRLSYVTRMDRFTFGSTLLILLVLVEVVLALSLSRKQHVRAAIWTDIVGRLVVPLAFAGLVVYSFLI